MAQFGNERAMGEGACAVKLDDRDTHGTHGFVLQQVRAIRGSARLSLMRGGHEGLRKFTMAPCALATGGNPPISVNRIAPGRLQLGGAGMKHITFGYPVSPLRV